MIINLDVKDAAAFEAYKVAVPAVIGKYGGEPLVRGGETEVVEGDWRPAQLVLFRFPDLRSIRAFLDAPEYQPLKALRQRVAYTEVVAAEGL